MIIDDGGMESASKAANSSRSVRCFRKNRLMSAVWFTEKGHSGAVRGSQT